MFILILPLLLLAFSLYFLIKLKFFFFTKPHKIACKISHALSDKSSRHSLCLALAGTLGVGNILGVAMGVIIGGVGTVFWIFISGFFSAVIKYCECTLSADMSNGECGGMHECIKHSFKKNGARLSFLYLLFCLLLSLTMGTMLQSNAISSSFFEGYGIQKIFSGVLFSILVLIFLGFLSKKTDRLTAVIIPLTTVIYLILMLSAVFVNIEKLPSAVTEIVKDAFTVKSAISGSVLSFNLIALREGFARGLLSNEAGAGTSSMAQTRQNQPPTTVGLMGVCEVFFDTTLLCTLTGLAIAISIENTESFNTGMDLITEVVRKSNIPCADAILPWLIFMFALSTVICWYYYGAECIKAISGKDGILYKALFLASVFLGAVFNPKPIIHFVDYILLFMTSITLFTLKKNSERIVLLSEKNGLLK